MTKRQAVELLTKAEIEYIKIANDDYLINIIQSGLKGYNNLTNKQLEVEYLETFKRKIRIK